LACSKDSLVYGLPGNQDLPYISQELGDVARDGVGKFPGWYDSAAARRVQEVLRPLELLSRRNPSIIRANNILERQRSSWTMSSFNSTSPPLRQRCHHTIYFPTVRLFYLSRCTFPTTLHVSPEVVFTQVLFARSSTALITTSVNLLWLLIDFPCVFGKFVALEVGPQTKSSGTDVAFVPEVVLAVLMVSSGCKCAVI
jgi:hypothetical protein